MAATETSPIAPRHAAAELDSVLVELAATAARLGHDRTIQRLEHAAQLGAFQAAGAEWLPADKACLVASECSRQVLDWNAKQGVIEKRGMGSNVTYSKSSINAAIRDRRWLAIGKLEPA